MRIGHVDLNQLRGLVDKGLGLGKELTGFAVGNDRLQDEGKAQQERGSKEIEALKAEARAQKERAEARTKEGQQRAAQKAKENANA